MTPRGRLRHAVFMTCAYPRDLRSARHGGYQRMGSLLLALREVVSRLDVVLFRRDAAGAPCLADGELQEYLREAWHVEAVVSQILTADGRSGRGRVQEYVRPLVNPLDHSAFPGALVREQADRLAGILGDGVDLIVARDLYSMKPLLSVGPGLAPIVMDLDNIEHKTMARSLRQPPHYLGKVLLFPQVVSMALCERQLIRQTAATLVCSEGDRRWLRRVLGVRNLEVVPNSARGPECVSPPPDSGQVLFLGTFSYDPNRRAADWLLREIWPRVLARRPSARLVIAGARPETIPSFAAAGRSVHFTGFVEDLDQLYRDTQVVVCPITYGGGTRIKIIEAAMHARPVVSTRLGAEGLPFQPPDEIRLHDATDPFADACATLLESRPLCERIGLMAREAALTRYSSESVRQVAREVYLRCAGALDTGAWARSPGRREERG